LKFGLFDAGTYPNFPAVKSALEETYACLGITCAQVGFLQSSGTALAAATAACTYSGPSFQLVMTLAGAVTDFNAPALAAIKASMASKLDVAVAQITLTVVAASVTLTASVKADSTIQSAGIASLASSYLTSNTKASELLGAGSYTVESIVSTTLSPPPPPPSPAPTMPPNAPNMTAAALANVTASPPAPLPPSSPVTVLYQTNATMPGWGIAIIVVLAVTAALVCALVVIMRGKEKAGKPMFTTMVSPNK
jgi:hypothetical protein